MDRLQSFVSSVLDRNGDKQVGAGELSAKQLETLAGKSVGDSLSTKQLAKAVRDAGATDPAAQAAEITKALQSPDGKSMFFSGMDMAHYAQRLGLTVTDCRVSTAHFQERVQAYLSGEKVGQAAYRTVYQERKEVRDPYSYANTHEVRVKHVNVQLDFDFANKTIYGEATYDIEQLKAAREMTLDTHSLKILKVTHVDAQGNKKDAPYSVGKADPHLGTPLHLPLHADTKQYIVRYKTNAPSTAKDAPSTGKGLMWMSAEQTYSGKKPFFFMQGQPYNNRGLMPLQDTTMVKATYSGRIRVKSSEGLRVAVTSNAALGDAVPIATQVAGYDVWPFKIDVPIQSYIFGVSVGELEARRVGPRTVVYAEPHLIDNAAKDYAKFEQAIVAAEELFGPLPTRQLSMIMMPPSYPYGGMETFALNQVNGADVSGTDENLDVKIHELAHSWFGNMVTNSRLDDFWLNEGFTTWAERLIIEKVYGPKAFEISRVNGFAKVNGFLRDPNSGARTCLAVETKHENPDHWITHLPYQKGSLFVSWLEQRVGREAMLGFVRQYLKDYRFASMSTQEFVDYALSSPPFGGVVTRAEFEEWIYGPGLPAGIEAPKSPALAGVESTAQRWITKGADKLPESQKWNTQEWIKFLHTLNAASTLPGNVLPALHNEWKLGSHANMYLQQVWLQLAIKHKFAPADEALRQYCDGRVGRISMLLPIFGGLKAAGRADFAKELYDGLRPKLHPLGQKYIDKTVYGNSTLKM